MNLCARLHDIDHKLRYIDIIAYSGMMDGWSDCICCTGSVCLVYFKGWVWIYDSQIMIDPIWNGIHQVWFEDIFNL